MPKKLTQDEYEYRVKLVNPKISVVGKYDGSNVKIMHKCLNKDCGHEWLVSPHSILRHKTGCPKCAYKNNGKNRALTQDEYIKRIAESNKDIKLIDSYVNNSTPISHMCCICGHGSDGKWLARPSHIMNGHGCPVCSGNIIGNKPDYKNSIWSQDKYYAFFKDYLTEEQMKANMPNTHAKIKVRCPKCGRYKYIAPNILFKQGLQCICGDGISYPNKFMYSFLEQSKIDFDREVSFGWSKGKIYDFYIKSLNCIIECHGAQHYVGWGKDEEDKLMQHENDIKKIEMAINNGIDKEKYIVIDCSKSDKYFITNNIEKSGLLKIIGIDISNIDIDKCDSFAISNIVKLVCDMWNEGYSISEIKKRTKISTVNRYLNMGNELGWCTDCTPEERRKRGAKRGLNNHKSKPVYCEEINKVFMSMTDAGGKMQCNPHAIYMCCVGSWSMYRNMHWHYVYDVTRKNGDIINGAMSLGLITIEEIKEQLHICN